MKIKLGHGEHELTPAILPDGKWGSTDFDKPQVCDFCGQEFTQGDCFYWRGFWGRLRSCDDQRCLWEFRYLNGLALCCDP
jgi:hypothetical protein